MCSYDLAKEGSSTHVCPLVFVDFLKEGLKSEPWRCYGSTSVFEVVFILNSLVNLDDF
jgi:hypothetical protein